MRITEISARVYVEMYNDSSLRQGRVVTLRWAIHFRRSYSRHNGVQRRRVTIPSGTTERTSGRIIRMLSRRWSSLCWGYVWNWI